MDFQQQKNHNLIKKVLDFFLKKIDHELFRIWCNEQSCTNRENRIWDGHHFDVYFSLFLQVSYFHMQCETDWATSPFLPTYLNIISNGKTERMI